MEVWGYYIIFFNILKSIKQQYPKLYINISNKNNDNYIIEYYSNQYNDDGTLRINSELISVKSFKETSQNKKKLYDLNKTEFQLLINLIKKQEKVVEIYSSKNKYDQFQVVNSSLDLLFEYKKMFLKWFSKNSI